MAPQARNGGPSRPGRGLGTLSWGVVLLAAALALTRGVTRIMEPVPTVSGETLARALPEAAVFERRTDPIPHYLGFAPDGRAAGAVMITTEIPPKASGYLGEIATAVGVDPSGRVRGVLPFRHRETPYYMDMVASSGILEALASVNLAEPFPAMDAVSGATVSSNAILRDVREAATKAAEALYGIPVPAPVREDPDPWLDWRVLALAVSLLLAAAASTGRSTPALRSTALASNLLTVGVLVNSPVTLSALGRILSLDLPGAGNPAFLMVLLFAVAALPFFGRAYCRLVCPFGAIQHFLSQFWRWPYRPPPSLLAVLPDARRILLAVLLTAAVWAGWEGFGEVEPFFALFSFRLTALAWTFAIIIICIGIVWRRFWCNALCPTGTLFACASRILKRGGSHDEV